MKYDRKKIFEDAWRIFRKGKYNFSESLRRAWITAKATEENAKKVREAKEAAGITEETRSWYGWKMAGYEVIHGSKALFKAVLITGDTKNCTYKKAYFGASQVAAVA